MSDDDIDSIPDMPVRQVWRPVGTWEHKAAPVAKRRTRKPVSITADQQSVLDVLARVQPATRDQIAAAIGDAMTPVSVSNRLMGLAARGLCKSAGPGRYSKWVIA